MPPKSVNNKMLGRNISNSICDVNNLKVENSQNGVLGRLGGYSLSVLFMFSTLREKARFEFEHI